MNKALWRASAITAVALALITGAAAAPANAAESTTTKSADENCGYNLDTGEMTCVPLGEDLHAAVLEETGVSVIDAAALRSAQTVGPLASYLIARLYDDQNYGGSYIEFFQGAACNGSTVYAVSNIGSAWYGRVSAVRGYSNCSVKIFEQTNYGGASYGYVSSAAYVGDAMNDRTKSLQVR